MRFNVNETLFAVHFAGAQSDRLFYRTPLLHDFDQPEHILFTKLLVTEHHKVRWDYDNSEDEAKYDGYILKDDEGEVFHNQYPRASYGQLDDTADRRFKRACADEENAARNLMNRIEKDAGIAYSYNLLTDSLENIKKGIRDLEAMKDSDTDIPANIERAKLKAEALNILYERTVKEFHEKFPDYEIKFSMEQAYKGSKLIWPRVRIYLRDSVQ